MRIDLHTQAFNTLVPDGNGTHWMATGLEGWDAPGLRQAFQNPTGRHGAVTMESMLDSRALTLAGVVKSPTESTFWIAYNGLLGLVNNLVEPRLMKVYEGAVVKRISVIRGGQPRLSFKGVGAFEFEIPLLALDPLKYAETVKSGTIVGGTQTLTNDGTFETNPVLTLTTAGTVHLDNYSDPGLDILSTASTVLPSGTVIDFSTRTLKSGSASYYAALASTSVFWTLRPGANTIYSAGSAALSYTFRDAWI